MVKGIKFIFLFFLLTVSPLSSEAGLGPPHNIAKCSDCHAGGFAEGLFSVTPNCLNCHGSGKLAASRPFAENDASRLLNYSSSGTGQNISHAWGVTVNEPRAGSSYPSDILGTYVSKVTRSVQKVSCPSCHAVHYRVYPKMLRGPYESLDYTAYGIGILYGVNQLCLECHSARNQTHHTGHSHPVRVQLPDDQARFNYPPYLDPAFAHVSSSILKLYSTPGGPDTVMCLTCHGIHMTDSNPYTFDRFTTYSSAMENLSTGDGFLLRQYNDSTLCRNCHDYQFHNAMVCRNCHDPHSVGDNYYLIMNNISTPTIGGNSYGNISVSLTNLSSGFVLFNDTGPRGVCETCHRLSTDSPSGALFQGWSSAHAALGINKSDAPNYNCLECHNHKVGTGTKSFAGCNGCHGTPPNSNVAGGPDGYASFAGNSYLNDGPFLDESQTPHRKHAIDYPFGNQGAGYGTAGQCRACHSNDKSLHMNTVYQNVNFGLHSTTGDGRNYNTGTRQCSNVYCHSNSGPWDGASYTAPTYRPPTWGAPGTLPGAWQCEGCHDWPPPTNKHPTHADGDYATKPYSFDCANCHDATVDNYSTIADTSYHVNKEKNVIFGHIAKTGGANPFYNATTHRCSNVYCHGNFPYGNNTTVQWDSESPCGSCHDVPNTATSHDRHVTDYNFDCANCHEATMDVSSSDISGYDVHVDGEKTVEFGIARDGVIDNRDGISTTGPRKCDNIYCHSRGTDFDAPFDTITSEPNSQATWAAAISCNYCHGNTVYSDWRKAMPNYTTGSPKGNSHQTHVINNGVECYTCHSVTLANSSTIGSTVTHVNKEYNIDVITTYDAGGFYYDGGQHKCFNVKCHGGNPTPAWGDSISCEDCHFSSNDVDDFTYGSFTGIQAKISQSQWTSTGHGRSILTFFESGNYGPQVPCQICHDSTVSHGDVSNPFRLMTSENNPDILCLQCHGDGDGLEIMIFATNLFGGSGPEVDCPACHIGSTLSKQYSLDRGIKSHTFAGMSEAGGYQNHTSWRITPKCIDCHDPHGDDNLFMAHSKVNSGGSNTFGAPNTFLNKSTVIFNSFSGDGSYATNNDTSVCQTCHTTTDHFRQNGLGGASDQNHDNAGGMVGKKCTPTCHNHQGGFAHGLSGESGTGCVYCHGHEPGTLIDEDMTVPVVFGTHSSMGTGTTTPHSTHTETDADDQRGPGIYCASCHDIADFPFFKSGTDANGDGKFNLEETDVCDTCHSPEGTYNGVNTVNDSVGAKDNWHTGGVYNGDGSLKTGKEKWCAGCHDEASSEIGGVVAPPVIGNETGTYTYGTGWGFYKTGHGLPTTETLPDSGGIKPGPGKACDHCHNSTRNHIDGNARTFDCSDGCDSTEYLNAYRLNLQGGLDPMEVPRLTANSSDNNRLCLTCHNSTPFLIATSTSTNFRTLGVNRHEYHLAQTTLRYAADYSGSINSRITCVACHNVHGSKNLAMIRSGNLIGKPTIKIWYNNTSIVTIGDPPVPDNIPLSASDGVVWVSGSTDNHCSTCHSSGAPSKTTRTPFQDITQAPTLAWTGETGYLGDGATPDSALAASTFDFHVEYADNNNDAPSPVQVWIDENDNGSYESGEKYAMTELDDLDTNLTDGKIYMKAITLNKAGDNILNYRFYASDGTDDATGDPIGSGSVILFNNAPSLAWTGETDYENDGVTPEVGGNGAMFAFRISYSDPDNEYNPSSGSAFVKVGIDVDDSGTIDADEKFDMAEVSGADTDATDGKFYVYSTNLSFAGTGIYDYRFYGYDGFANTSSISQTLTVQSGSNTPPTLAWVSGDCMTEGVRPNVAFSLATTVFRIEYTDIDNDVPNSGSLLIDLDNNGDYLGVDEQQPLSYESGDGIYTNGEIYRVKIKFTDTYTGTFKYKFSASDGTDDALGVPTVTDNDRTVTIYGSSSAKAVRPSGGTDPWFGSINTAVNHASAPSMVLVYPNPDFTAATYTENVLISNKSNRTIKSTCGADLTTIASSGGGNTIRVQNVSANIVVDGFSIAGATGTGPDAAGVSIDSAGTSVAVKNSKIHGNTDGISMNNGALVDIFDNEIYDNSSNSVYSNAAASFANISGNIIYSNRGHIYFNGGTHRITGTTFQNNSTIAAGAAVYWNGGGATVSNSSFINNKTTGNAGAMGMANGANVTVTGCNITGNSASGSGGALYISGSTTVDFTNCIISGNSASTGGAVYLHSATSTGFINTTFADNQATSGNGGVFASCNALNNTVRNSIFWNNDAAGSGENLVKECGASAFFTVTDSDINTSAGYVDGGTITESANINPAQDPLFVGGGDYHIRVTSPVVDQASATYAPANDIDGNVRPQGAADDMGADEVSAASGNAPTLDWVGSTGYVSDGVNPEATKTSFYFRIVYTDSDNDAPALIQVWLDADDNGAYSSDEKLDMVPEYVPDVNYSDGKNYRLIVPAVYAGDGVLKYRFFATDGAYDATGPPLTDATVTVYNDPPRLNWPNETYYWGTDGVYPLSGIGGTSFEFRISYNDSDNHPPSGTVDLWVDENDNGTFESFEKYSTTEMVPGDVTYSDGKTYSKTLNVFHAGDGLLAYRFFASDGLDDATGQGVTGKTITISNNTPTLTWTPEAGYAIDGVNPNNGSSGSNFTFRVDYTDIDNSAPVVMEVWIDENDNLTYEEGEKYTMNEADGADSDYTDGKRYTLTRALSTAGDTFLRYRFYASDSASSATGSPTSDKTVEVTPFVNTPPVLDWTGESNYTIDGVDPDSGAGKAFYDFRVKYTDVDGDAPSSIQLWVDENDISGYESGEKFTMTEVDAGDTDYTDGKLYRLSRIVPFVADGSVSYRFYANDGSADATSNAPVTSGGTVTVADPREVPSEYGTIAAAITAASSGDYILVADGSYAENISYGGKNITILSINGEGSTSITGTANNAVVTFSGAETSSAVLDGFTIDHGSSGSCNMRGINISGGSTPTFRNIIVKGNSPACSQSGGGMQINGGSATIKNSIFGGDASNKNIANMGAAIYAVNATATVTISNSTFSQNRGVNGGAIYMSNSPVLLTDVIFQNNSTTTDGGAIFLTGASTTASMTRTSIAYNTARGGGGIYASGISTFTLFSSTVEYNKSVSQPTGGVRVTAMVGDVTITGSSVSNNTGYTTGAGLYYTSTSAVNFDVLNSNFDDNTISITTGDGGGLYLSASLTTATFTNGSISRNSARNGAGLYLLGGMDLTMTGTVVKSNDAFNGAGGGLYVSGAGTVLDVYKTYIQGNHALSYGGGVYTASSGATTLTNCLITGNRVEGVSYSDGGGIYNGSTTNMYNSSVVGNYATRYGGGWVGGGTIQNSIFWVNSATTGPQIYNTTATVNYSDIEGGYGGGGTGNIGTNVVLHNPNFVGYSTATSGNSNPRGDYHIGSGSGPVDAGVNNSNPPYDPPADDIFGGSRPLGGGVDMGAHEKE